MSVSKLGLASKGNGRLILKGNNTFWYVSGIIE